MASPTINVNIIADFHQIDGLIDFFEEYPERVTQAVGQAWGREVEVDLVASLFFVPRESQNSLNSGDPFVWSPDYAKNLKAARWWFANLKKGTVGGGRTGALQDAYEVGISYSDNAVLMFVRNTSPYHKWVKGRYQIPGHERTGWQKDSEIIEVYAQDAREVAGQALYALITGTG